MTSEFSAIIEIIDSYGYSELRITGVAGSNFEFKTWLIENKIYFNENNDTIFFKRFDKHLINKIISTRKVKWKVSAKVRKYLGKNDIVNQDKILLNYGVDLFPCQISAINKILLDYPCFILNDESGCGKTYSALIAASIIGGKIIVKSRTKLSEVWVQHAKKLNIEIKIVPYINQESGDVLIVDDAHIMETSDAARRVIKKSIKSFKKAIFLTSVPLKTSDKLFQMHVHEILNGSLTIFKDIEEAKRRVVDIDNTISKSSTASISIASKLNIVSKGCSKTSAPNKYLKNLEFNQNRESLEASYRKMMEIFALSKIRFALTEIKKIKKQNPYNRIAVVSRFKNVIEEIMASTKTTTDPFQIDSQTIFVNTYQEEVGVLSKDSISHVLLLDLHWNIESNKNMISIISNDITSPIIIYPVALGCFDEKLPILPKLSSIESVLTYLKNSID